MELRDYERAACDRICEGATQQLWTAQQQRSHERAACCRDLSVVPSNPARGFEDLLRQLELADEGLRYEIVAGAAVDEAANWLAGERARDAKEPVSPWAPTLVVDGEEAVCKRCGRNRL